MVLSTYVSYPRRAESWREPEVPQPLPSHKPAEFSIDAQGRWYHRGSIIEREGLLRLLSGMLRLDERGYALVTPEQVLRVQVADVPFVVTDFDLEGEGREATVLFRTSLGENVQLDAAHPLRLREGPDGLLRPYIRLRDGMEAVVHRNVFYALAELARQEEPGGPLGIFSSGVFFPLE